MNPERVKALYDVCHAYRITTKVPNMKFIHVIADDGTITQKSPYTENFNCPNSTQSPKSPIIFVVDNKGAPCEKLF